MRVAIRLSALVASIACFVTPRSAAAGEFALVHFDSFESCALSYADADADAHGSAFGVRHECDPAAPGRIRTGGDCNDGDSTVHVDIAEPNPDAAFADENCDGVDGDVDLAIFAAPDGAGVPCGSRATPCDLASMTASAQQLGKTQLYLARGDYAGRLSIAGGLFQLYGGYSVDYAERAPVSNDNASRILGESGPTGSVGAWLFAANVALNDLRIESPVAVGQLPNGDGTSSVGLYVDEAIATVTRSEIVAGSGADGDDGGAGLDATTLAAASFMNGVQGGDGAEFESICETTSRGAAGGAGVNSCTDPVSSRATNAGAGGRGGTMDTTCGFTGSCGASGNCTARAGEMGADAAFVSGTAGKGGLPGSGGDACGPTTGGITGAIADGSGGTSVVGFDIALPLGFARAGGNGTTGDNGGGGGGGGGAGGCDVGTDAYGAGGGGGGAGGCAARSGGSGGRGGGASIGVVVFDGQITFGPSASIQSATGGTGGNGGEGAEGQAPGLGNMGGAFPGGAAAGRGGDGGRGGHSGGGAGGNGGASIGLLLYAAAPFAGEPPDVTAGPPGLPGSGGPGPTQATTGTPGAPGISAPVRACATPAC